MSSGAPISRGWRLPWKRTYRRDPGDVRLLRAVTVMEDANRRANAIEQARLGGPDLVDGGHGAATTAARRCRIRDERAHVKASGYGSSLGHCR